MLGSLYIFYSCLDGGITRVSMSLVVEDKKSVHVIPVIQWRFHERTGIAEVKFARTKYANALRPQDIFALGDVFRELEHMSRKGDSREVKCCILHGEGKHFCAGLDLDEARKVFGLDKMEGLQHPEREASDTTTCVGIEREKLLHRIKGLQDSVSLIESSSFPVIAAVNGACFGLGVDIIACCDIVLSTSSARFCVKEVDQAITADIGSLQRLPLIIGLSHTRYLAMTAAVITGETAADIGLVQKPTVETSDSLLLLARNTASLIAQKPTLAVRGTKRVLNKTNKGNISDGLDYVATLNAAIMVSEQLKSKLNKVKSKL